MSPEQAWVKEDSEKSALKCIEALKRKNFGGHYFESGDKALNHILWSIPPWVSVGFGDSETVDQIGLPGALHDRGQTLISAYWEDDPRTHTVPTAGKAFRVGKQATQADYFVTGINAITVDGKIVNTDAGGNRVAATIYGPGKVILVAGTNKIVPNLEAAFERIRKVAAPQNSYRFQTRQGMEHGLPCGTTGECIECDICPIHNITVIIEHQLFPRIDVILIGEKLGL